MDFDTAVAALIKVSLLEDGDRDVTSEALCPEDMEVEAIIQAKQDGVVCGLGVAEKVLAAVDESLVFEPFLDEGDPIKERMMLGSLAGSARSLLKVERVLLNFLARMSGIATMTKALVDEVQDLGGVILDTRKTVPAWRFVDKYAVGVGGGINHRMGLSDVAMIKDTHVDACGGVDEAIETFRKADAEMPLIVEVRDLKEFSKALKHAKVLNRIILDNFPLDLMKEAVEMASGKVLLEASGGVTVDNAREIAETGVHFLSVGAITHSVRAFDWSFQMSR